MGGIIEHCFLPSVNNDERLLAMKNGLKLFLAVGFAFGVSELLKKAAKSGHSDIAKLSLDGYNKYAKSTTNNEGEKIACDILTDAIKAEIDYIAYDEKQRRQPYV